LGLGYRASYPKRGLRDPSGGTESPFSHRMSVNEHPTRPPRDPGTVSHHLLYEFTTGFDRFTNGSEIDEMLVDILFIYALMGAIEIDEMWADMPFLYALMGAL